MSGAPLDGAERVVAVYERRARVFDAGRSRLLFERVWLDRLLARTRPGDTILHVGCGAGEPIAAHFVAQGRRLHGIAAAEPMLAIARSRLPDQQWTPADMRSFDLGRSFAGVVAWDSFFHLAPDAQRTVVPKLCRHVAPGGGLLVTVGPKASEAWGTVGGEPIYHASLEPAECAMLLQGAGMRLAAFVADDPDCDRHSLLLGVR
jgi:trans-aconitate methyltransferase